MSRIPLLPAAAPLTGDETIPLVQGGVTKRANYAEFANPILSEMSDLLLQTQTSAASIAGTKSEVDIGLGLGAEAVRLLEASGSITPSCVGTFTQTSGVQYELVVVARAQGTRRNVQLINTAPAVQMNIAFDLGSNTWAGGSGSTNLAVGSTRDLGGGFYECKATVTATGTGSTGWQVRPSPAGVFPFTGNTSEGVWVKSIVLRVAGTTTNLFASSSPTHASFTKISLTPTAGTVPEQRTSERIASMDARTLSLEQNVIGTMTATRMTEASGAALSVRAFRSIAIPVGNSFRLQFQAKAGERTIMRSFSQNGLAHTVSFNLSTGVATGTGASMVQLHNNYFECIYEGVSTLGDPVNWQVQMTDAGAWPYTGNGTSSALLHRARVTNLTTGVVLLDTIDWTTGWTLTSATMTANAALFGGILPQNMGAASTAHPLFGKKVAVLGTSLVAQNFWTSAFQSATGCILINLGVGGGSFGLTSGPYVDSRIGECSTKLNTTDIPADVAAIFIDNPVNEQLWRVPVGAVTDTTNASFAGAMTNASIWSATNRPNVPVIYTQITSAEPSYPTHRHGGLASGGQSTLAELEAYQDMMARVVRREGRTLIDLNDWGISWRDLTLRSDGLHWNTTSGPQIGQILAQETRRLALPGWLP